MLYLDRAFILIITFIICGTALIIANHTILGWISWGLAALCVGLEILSNGEK